MRRGFTAVLAFFLVCALGALLGCGPEDAGTGDASGTTAQRTEANTRTVEETSNVEPPDVAEVASAGIDESSIRTHLST